MMNGDEYTGGITAKDINQNVTIQTRYSPLKGLNPGRYSPNT